MESKIAAMRAEFALQKIASLKATEEQHALAALAAEQRVQMRVSRGDEAPKLATPHRANSRKSK